MMKKLIVLICLFATPLYADQWCQWDGSKGINCQGDERGYILTPFPVKTPSVANAKGWYRLIITEPTIGVNETKNAEVWSFENNLIEKTWTVRAMTQNEIDIRNAQPMAAEVYYLWNVVIQSGLYTQQQLVTYFQNKGRQDLIDAYIARDRLENP